MKNKVKIKRLHLGNALYIPRLVQLVLIYWKEQYPHFISPNSSHNVKKIFQDALWEPSTHIYFCIEKKRVLGFIILHVIPFPMLGGRECYISDLLVDRSQRGKGFGSYLIACVERSFGRQCVRIMLNNDKQTETYQSGFYKKQGFTERLNFSNFIKKM